MGRRNGRGGTTGLSARTHQEVLQEAARLLAEGGASSYEAARRKAANRLGLSPHQRLPDNAEIEQALIGYQRLFRSDSQPLQLRQLREAALKALRLLERFDPRLVGPVLAGTADTHTPVHIHLFADNPESVALYLMDRHIPFEQDERRVRFAAEQWELLPLYRFVAGEVTLELTVFPAQGLRRAPLSPVDNRPMRRADVVAVAQLLAEEPQA